MHALSRIYRSTLAFKARLFTLMLALPAITVLAFASAPVAHAQPDIPTVLIDKANNAKDTTGYGAVSYNYYIGATEVTNAQYAAFLNSVAQTDPNGLYNTNMAGTYGGITRSGSSGSYTYTATRANAPVNYVSFFDAARFCNWLSNGANGTADTETGMYKLSDGGLGMTRNADAWAAGGYAITSEDEWYKAAYYDLATETYTTYATGNTISTSRANYDWSTSFPYVKDAGSYPAEQNDTYDMMGNVYEWTEGITSSSYRCIRGGTYYSSADGIESSYRGNAYPDSEDNDFGFRVSSLTAIPEPSTYGILGGAAALLGAVVLRRRSRRD